MDWPLMRQGRQIRGGEYAAYGMAMKFIEVINIKKERYHTLQKYGNTLDAEKTGYIFYLQASCIILI